MNHHGELWSIVVDHDTIGARSLGRANNPDAGLVVAPVAPDLRRRFELGWAVLEALGKTHNVSGAGRHDEKNWELLHAWLAAHDITDVVMLDAQWLSRDLLDDLAGLVATCGVNVWLVAHHPASDRYIDDLARWPHRTDNGTALVDVLKTKARLDADPLDTTTFPQIPTDNWPTFRHAARQALTADEFAIVDRVFVDAYEHSRDLFTEPDVDEKKVISHLRDLTGRCQWAAEMLTCIRGVQVAAHRGGWLVQADLGRMLDTATEMADTAAHSPATWRRLRAYREPYRGTACALAAAQLTVGTMAELRCSDIDPDSGHVHVDGLEATVPEHGRVFVKAQLAHRANCGAEPDDLLFSDDDRSVSIRSLADALKSPAVEVGVPVNGAATIRADAADQTRWKARWGVSVQELR